MYALLATLLYYLLLFSYCVYFVMENKLSLSLSLSLLEMFSRKQPPEVVYTTLSINVTSKIFAGYM